MPGREPSSKRGSMPPLLASISRELVSHDLQNFADAVGLPAGLLDNEGNWVGTHSRHTEFCRLIRSTPEGEESCRTCDEKRSKGAARKGGPIVYRCHAGLVDFAAPIMAQGRSVGTLLGGQVLPSRVPEKDIVRFRKVARKIGVDEEKLVAASYRVPTVSYSRVREIADRAAKTAQMIALAALNTRRMEEVQRATARFYSAGDETGVLEALMDAAEQMIGFFTCSVTIPDEQRRHLRVVGHRRMNPTLVKSVKLPFDKSLAGWVYEQEKPTVVADLDEDSRVSGEYRSRGTNRRARACVAAPLKGKTGTVGVIQLGACRRGAYSNADVEMLSTLSTQAASAIELLRFRDVQVEQDITNEVYALCAKQENASVMRSRLFDIIVVAMHRLPNVDWSSVRLLDEGTGDLFFVAWKGDEWDEKKVRRTYSIGQSGVGAGVVKRKRSKLVPDVREDSEYTRLFERARSHASVPVLTRGRVIGVLSVDSTKLRRLDHSHIVALERLARLAATALDNVQLYVENRLAEIERKLNEETDLTTVLDDVVSMTADLVGADSCSVFLWDEVSGDFVLAGTTGLTTDYSSKDEVRYKPGEGVTGWVAKHGKPLRVMDVGDKTALRQIGSDLEWKNRYPEKLPGAKHKSPHYMACPMKLGDKVIGVIRVASNAINMMFAGYDERALMRVAETLAESLEKRQLRDAQDERVHQLVAIARVARDVSNQTDLREAVRTSLEEGLDVIGCHSGHIRLYDEASRDLLLVSAVGEFADLVPERRALGEGMSGYAAKRKKDAPLVIQDTSKNRRWQRLLTDAKGTEYENFLRSVKAEVSIPLRVGNKLVGVFNAHRAYCNSFSEVDVAVLRQLFAHIAAAIEDIRLLNRAQARADALTGLTQMTAGLAGELRFQNVLGAVLTTAAEVMPVEGCHLFLWDRERGKLVLRASNGPSRDAIGRWEYELGEGLTGFVAQSGEPVRGTHEEIRSHDARKGKYDDELLAALESHEFRNHMLVPIKGRARTLGVLTFDNKKPSPGEVLQQSFSDIDEEVATILGWQIAAAVERASAFENVGALYQCATSIAPETKLQSALQMIVDHAGELLGTNRAAIHLIEADGKTLKMRVLCGSAPRLPETDLQMDGKSITAHVARTGDLYYAPEVAHDPHYLEFFPDTSCELAVPINAGRRTLGVLNVESPLSGAFTESDVGLVKSLASLASVAIQRSEAMAQMLRAQRVAGMGLLAASIAHQVNNVLQIILVNAERVERLCGDPELKECLAALMRAAGFGSAFVRRLEWLSRPRDDPRAPCSLNPIVLGVAELVRNQLARQGIEVELDLADDLPTVIARENLLAHVVMNLVLNARDAMPQGGRLTLRTRRAGNECVHFSCTDTGKGIPPEDLSHLFEPWFTTKPAGLGVGLGLYVVRQTVEEHGGCVDVSSTPGKGSKLTVVLPILPQRETQHGATKGTSG